MSAPDSIHQLVGRFEEQRGAYHAGKYNETQLRSDFLNPFFEALGWDVLNHKGYAERYREVMLEQSVEVEGQAKAADYAFRVGDKTLFFVEAKKPAVNIAANPEPAFQVRRYGWSAKLSLSLLSDFEQLAVYDCRSKPKHSDPAACERVELYSFREYIEKWNEISARFSREAVLKGSFDQFAGGMKGKKGTADVDDAFLEEMEHWREDLAHNIALRNLTLSQRELNSAVQTTIDRMIFLRICEERGIEAEDALHSAAEGKNVYENLVSLFKQADKKYNSGLFHFYEEKKQSSYPDRLTLRLQIDDKVLKDILAHLYYPLSPYAFKYIPTNILGQVYERFLGKVIRLTAGHQARVEEKPEVRKAGGVYYTPTYIVEYIVKHTLGELLKDQTAESQKNQPLRVLDPACGSGSFLLGAYQYLLDWYLDWYIHNDPGRWAKGKDPAVVEGQGGWQLTMDKKKEILLSHIYGVDIDAQAVEVTKLSLLLRVVESPGQLSWLNERILPDLGENIQCGNSLIGSDYYDNRQMPIFGDEEFYRVNPFDWQKAFSQVFAVGGFDAVIGNPPYGQVVEEGLKHYFATKFITTEGRIDTFELFIEKGLNLCRYGRVLGYIIPSPLLSNVYSRKLRKYLLDQCSIHEITNFGMNVFSDPTIHTCIIILERGKKEKPVLIRKKITDILQLNTSFDYEISQSKLGANKNFTFDIFIEPRLNELIFQLRNQSKLLGEYCFIRQCIKTGNDSVYVDIFDNAPDEPWKPTLRGRSIARYSLLEKREYVKYGTWLARNWQNKTFYETPKIAIRETGNRIIATLDLESRYFLSSLYAIYPKSADNQVDIKYFLGLLNSKLATFFVRAIALDLTEGAFTKFRTNQLSRLPIHTINFSDPADTARHARMVGLVEGMLALHKQAAAARLPQDKEMIQRQIEATDAQIDRLVYELYGLTEEEIKIVEGG